MEDNIKMDVKRTGMRSRGLETSDSAQGPVAGCCKYGCQLWGSVKRWAIS